MKIINKTTLLFIVIVLEGYVVLSSEMLAIRQSIPFVGSGTDTVSIIIAAVLMPLAFGYYYGGNYRPGLKNGKSKSIRQKLVTNIIIAQVIFMVGLSFYTLSVFFLALMEMGVGNRLVMTAIYSLLFLVVPVFLLGQTIPLVSNYFSKQKLSEITGRMLFLSTLGSFLGAVFSTLILMAFIGVHYTVVVISAMLTLLVFMLSKEKITIPTMFSLIALGLTYMANSDQMMKSMFIVEDNQYNTIMAYEDSEDGSRHMVMNMTASSKYDDKGNKHEYIEYAEKQVIDPVRDTKDPKEFLIIGAGAFTFGYEDPINQYDFIDLDKSLKGVAEQRILRNKLKENHKFIPMEARAYLMGTDKKYDVIFLDAYNGDLTLPEHLVTEEFYAQVRKHLKPHGIVIANFIMSPNFESPFSRHLDNTFRKSFPHVSRHPIDGDYKLWNTDPNFVTNVIYMYTHHEDEKADRTYTDNINRVFYDKPHSRSIGEE